MVQTNQREGAPDPISLEECQRRVRLFLTEEPPFAQVVTVNAAGFPVARTMVAPVADDLSVELVQRHVHHRIGQWRRNPNTEVIWVGSPHQSNRNLRPHVYDWSVQVPRVVFLRGVAEFMTDDELVVAFERQDARNREAGRTLAPERNRDNVLAELVGVRIRPIRVRAEGFGMGPESYSWKVAG